MEIAITGAIAGLVGVIVGGAIQFWLTRHFENLRFERDTRREAYLRYLEGVGQLSFVPDDNDAHLAAHAIMAEARGRIALSGSDWVIMCMNRVFQHGDDLYSIEAQNDLKALIAAMRKDTLGSVLPEMDTELLLLMYGSGPGHVGGVTSQKS